MTEADYLRGELLRARGMLAQAAGILLAAETIAPDLAALLVTKGFLAEYEEFKKRGVAVLPKGVTR